MASANLIAQLESKLDATSAALDSKLWILMWVIGLGVLLISAVTTLNMFLD